MKRIIPAIAVGVLALSMLLAADQPKRVPSQLEKDLMRAKVPGTQKVVIGLIEKNFEKIQQGGEELVKIGETAEWAVHDDQVYNHFRTEFRRQAQKLATFGEQQNLEGATYAYMGMIMTCVECHSHCRDVLRIAAEPPDLKPVPLPERGGEERRTIRR